MNIYHVYRLDQVTWDEYEGHIVRAETARRARELANSDPGDEGKIWLNEGLVGVDVVGIACADDIEGIILSSFNAG